LAYQLARLRIPLHPPSVSPRPLRMTVEIRAVRAKRARLNGRTYSQPRGSSIR
jgi:hypothetical protein